MRFMFIARPRFPIPPEAMLSLIDGFVAWWERYRDRWESAGFFAGTAGGGGICTVASPEEYQQMILEWPFGPFTEMESHALVDMDTALGQWQALLATVQQGNA